MKIIIRFIKFLFTLFAGAVFILSLILVVPCYFFIFTFYPKEKAPRIAHGLSKRWAKTVLTFFLIRVKVIHKEYINPEQTYVFVANHQSQIDIPAYAVSCSNTLRFLAKKELTKIPLLGYVINHLYISVDRKDKAAKIKSMENMMASLREGVSVFICPEGTRNRTDQPLLSFHDGAFRLAIESQLPLAVLTIKGAEKLLSPLRPLELSPGTLTCIWSKPVETKGMTMNDLEALKENARGLMMECLADDVKG
ncbi:MAG: lysophospholipid acyltransferase family protein [Bacteroidetes bacterium]|nr:lysophospholipid acyltransferase family protein [Bacteroidota bacterium]